jgi:glycosyltransferase involved in cell wall biosynthesis
LKQQIVESNIEKNVILLGQKNNPYPYMKMCDIYVQPSRHEGYGITILEAKILEKVIVASNIEPIKEQIIDGETGILVIPEAENFADAIISLMVDKDKAKVLTENLKKINLDYSKEYIKLLNIVTSR